MNVPEVRVHSLEFRWPQLGPGVKINGNHRHVVDQDLLGEFEQQPPEAKGSFEPNRTRGAVEGLEGGFHGVAVSLAVERVGLEVGEHLVATFGPAQNLVGVRGVVEDQPIVEGVLVAAIVIRVAAGVEIQERVGVRIVSDPAHTRNDEVAALSGVEKDSPFLVGKIAVDPQVLPPSGLDEGGDLRVVLARVVKNPEAGIFPLSACTCDTSRRASSTSLSKEPAPKIGRRG